MINLPHSRAISPGQLIEASFCQAENMPAESPILDKIEIVYEHNILEFTATHIP